jgi:hypothetical protein
LVDVADVHGDGHEGCEPADDLGVFGFCGHSCALWVRRDYSAKPIMGASLSR